MSDITVGQWLSEFSLENFHFLRPQFLWLFAPLVVTLLLIILANREESKWKTIISQPLRKYMFSKPSKAALIWPAVFFFLAISFGILAASGPAWKRIEIPGVKSTAVMTILMDLSWSMMVEDIQPNRLERAKLKVRDLLDANPQTRTALFVYAGTAHPVMPLTSDYKLLRHHTDHLKANMMPVRGDNLNLAMDLLDTLFSRYEAPSTLLLMTDEVEEDEVDRLLEFVDSTPHRIEILAISTPSGGKVPGFRKNTILKDESGNAVISAPNQSIWDRLNSHEKIIVNPITLDQSDVEGIAKRASENLVFQDKESESQEEWQDEGVLFLIPTLLFGMFFFRKGWMIQWCILVVGLTFTACSPDDKHAELWYTDDYRGQYYENEGNYEEAANNYTDPNHKAAAYFKAGNYDAAASIYAQDTSAIGLYSYGLALANMGEYEEAKEAIEKAIAQDPYLAEKNMVLGQIETAIAVADSIKRFEPEKAEEEDKKPLVERQAQSEDEELSSDTEVEELPEDGDRITDEIETDVSQAEELERPPEDIDAGQEQDASKIMLRAISAEPTEFLRRRFSLQKDKYYSDVKEGKKKW